ncbi:MAG TPA: type IV secretory system conjugative DNA transfer family protein, partial [Chloroflexota bacterium]
AKGKVGENTAALLGGTLLNLVALAIAEQAELEPKDRRLVSLLVDEFQSVPGADFESILSELSKFGANLILATQSLARLDALDREHKRALRATVFANLDGVFAFHCSAEDARYLVNELGEDVDEQDLVALGEHRCYARLSARGERLPTFSVRLDPPSASDPLLAAEVARESALLYGRDRHAVEDDLRVAVERIRQAARRQDNAQDQGGSTGVSGGRSGKPGDSQPKGTDQARNQHRDQSKRPGDALQISYLPPPPTGQGDRAAPPLSETEDERHAPV